MPKKELWIIAGANGSGKTTLTQFYQTRFKKELLFINPDDIAKEIDDSYDGKDASLIYKAGKETVIRQNKLLARGVSFGYETTFSGKRDLDMIAKAEEQGYIVKLVYIGLSDIKDNIRRVNNRTIAGGHYVPPQDIQRRYFRSIENLAKALVKVNSVYIFDNSLDKHRLFVRIKDNKILRYAKNAPDWIRKLQLKVFVT